MLEFVQVTPVIQPVDHFLARKVAAFQQYGAGAKRQQFHQRGFRIRAVADGMAEQQLGLRDIRCDHAGHRQQSGSQGLKRCRLQ